MSEPREWWVVEIKNNYGNPKYKDQIVSRYATVEKTDKGIHVIEKSAYDALKAEVERLKNGKE